MSSGSNQQALRWYAPVASLHQHGMLAASTAPSSVLGVLLVLPAAPKLCCLPLLKQTMAAPLQQQCAAGPNYALRSGSGVEGGAGIIKLCQALVQGSF